MNHLDPHDVPKKTRVVSSGHVKVPFYSCRWTMPRWTKSNYSHLHGNLESSETSSAITNKCSQTDVPLGALLFRTQIAAMFLVARPINRNIVEAKYMKVQPERFTESRGDQLYKQSRNTLMHCSSIVLQTNFRDSTVNPNKTGSHCRMKVLYE